MKHLYTLLVLVAITKLSIAQPAVRQLPPNADTIKKNRQIFTAVEQVPAYPGGDAGFGQYISNNLKYPDVARLIGIDGRLVMTFIVERNGKISNATPINCIGAGCEAEAARVLQDCKGWKPGIQNGKLVRVQYSIPIHFFVEKGKVKMKDLRASDYAFVFNIKDKLYTLDEAQELIGKSFKSEQIKIAEPFYNDGNNPKYIMPDKKELYVIKLK